MDSLKAVHVTPYFDKAWAYGGIPRVVTDQVIGLAARGVEVEVVTTDACAPQKRLRRPDEGGRWRPHPPITRDGITTRVFPNLSNQLAYRRQFFVPLGMAQYLATASDTADVGHLHGLHNFPGVIAARRFSQNGRPYVVQPNGTAPRIERRRLAKLIFDTLFGRRTLPHASAVIAVTEFERKQLIANGAQPASVVVIPNPVDTDLQPAPGADLNFRRRWNVPNDPLAVYLGQLSPRKRVDLLLRAVAGSDSNIRVVVAGSDMGCRKDLENLGTRLGLGNRITFTGVLEGDDRFGALAAADVVVYPTQDEIFGLVPLEALLCGTPVVVSDDCGCGEVINRTGGGIVSRCGDAEALSDAISKVIGNPDSWRAPVMHAQQRIRKLFSREVVAEQLEGLYRFIAERSTETPPGSF